MLAASGAKVWIHEADARVEEEPDHQFDVYFAQRHVLVDRSDRLDAAREAFRVSTEVRRPSTAAGDW